MLSVVTRRNLPVTCAEVLPVLLLEVSLAQQHEADLEAEHANLAHALTVVHI